jgi:phenylacetate-CoA ligase
MNSGRDWKMDLYWRLPVVLQETALDLYAGRLQSLYYGPGFEEWKTRLSEWRSWSQSDSESWQNGKLQSLLRHAATRVPYYREKWKGIDWRSICSAGDLHLLPLLDKQEIRLREHLFITEGVNPKSLWMEKTSGSTGTSLRIYWPKSMLPKFWAVMEAMVRNVAGVAQDMPRAMVGGRPIVSGATSKPPYWRFNRRWRQLYLSSYHISTRTVSHYEKAIREYGCQWMTGYGSAMAALAEGALKTEIAPIPLRAVIASGDSLLPSMRKAIEQFFQCKCYDHYGQAEGVAMAMECPLGRMHVIPALGIIEVLREDGSPCQPGQVGEIVATGLFNDAMPLIRYRMGDYAAWAPDQSCACGNSQPTITQLEGRTDDYLITSDGRKIGRLSTAMKRSPTIHSAQIVQDQPGHAYLLVRPGEGYQSNHARNVRDDMLERIGLFELEIIEVNEIPKTPQGKTALVVRLAERPAMRDVYDRLLLARLPTRAHDGQKTYAAKVGSPVIKDAR